MTEFNPFRVWVLLLFMVLLFQPEVNHTARRWCARMLVFINVIGLALYPISFLNYKEI